MVTVPRGEHHKPDHHVTSRKYPWLSRDAWRNGVVVLCHAFSKITMTSWFLGMILHKYFFSCAIGKLLALWGVWNYMCEIAYHNIPRHLRDITTMYSLRFTAREPWHHINMKKWHATRDITCNGCVTSRPCPVRSWTPKLSPTCLCWA